MSSSLPFTATAPPSPQGSFPAGGGGNGGGGNGGGGESSTSNTNLANSASLYLYTFLATLVLLLSVSGAIVIRSFVLRRRQRRMVEEAMRNGTWIPPTPPARASRVDLSKKPELWEAHLGGGGWQMGSYGHGNGKEFESSRDWESIKPIYAGYAEPLTSSSAPHSGSTPNLSSPPLPLPIPIPIPTSRVEDEENRRTASTSATATAATTTPPSLLTRARIFLNPNSSSTIPVASSPDNNNSRSISANISMTELSSNSPPPTIRVAVLIAMPSPPSSSHGSSSTTPPPLLSASITSSSSSSSSKTPSHPLEPSSPTTLVRVPIGNKNDDEESLPHIEMGVADVVVVMGRSAETTWDNARKGEKEMMINHSRGSSYAEP